MSTVTLSPTARAAAAAVHATKVYGSEGDTAVRALDDVTVELPEGRFTAVMGPSGSGKSTLLHCLAGLDHPTEGHMFVGDVDLGSLSDKQLTLLRRDRIGLVFQSFNLVPTLTAAENIALPMLLAGRKPDQAWLDEVVATVGLADRLAHRPHELSGGQQQRVAVAGAPASRVALGRRRNAQRRAVLPANQRLERHAHPHRCPRPHRQTSHPEDQEVASHQRAATEVQQNSGPPGSRRSVPN